MSGIVNWHIGRCGSSVLGSLLAQHPSIAYSNEIYSCYMPRRRGTSSLLAIDSVLRLAEKSVSEDELHFFEVKHLPDQNIGLYPQLEVQDWLNFFLAKGYKHHLLMCRRNGLRRIVSHLRAAHSGQYVLGSSSSVAQSSPITIPLNGIVHGFGTRTLVGWLEEYERGHKVMQDCLDAMRQSHPGFSWLELVYEDHIEPDPYIAYRDVCGFLGLSFVDVGLQQRKINSGYLVDLIANFEEVRECLSPTRFAWMLSE
ncbi:hypothetical protein [Synechococcus sp. MU1617]|uniref:hypothetical protein n=1 Tax=Synechococcus sp. MU1617 TaxID=2508346 RepID=UPI001CF8331F|nr:hypothetical protein [Synechococcus sp. MU1617]MCB4389391.1 hypothetical protein [Synechococcus sp. MU1617]